MKERLQRLYSPILALVWRKICCDCRRKLVGSYMKITISTHWGI